MTELTKLPRGILTVVSLKAHCIVNPCTHCWIWQGATSHGQPRLHTLDYARGEKRVMSGPLAAWHIAHEEPPPAWAQMVFRACGTKLCLNPAHIRAAKHRAEIGIHQRNSGSLIGISSEARLASAAKGRHSQGIVDTPSDIVRAIRQADRKIPGTHLADRKSVV